MVARARPSGQEPVPELALQLYYRRVVIRLCPALHSTARIRIHYDEARLSAERCDYRARHHQRLSESSLNRLSTLAVAGGHRTQRANADHRTYWKSHGPTCWHRFSHDRYLVR